MSERFIRAPNNRHWGQAEEGGGAKPPSIDDNAARRDAGDRESGNSLGITRLCVAVPVPRGVWLLAGLFVTSGTLHFVAPRRFETIVPHALPAKRALVYASGAAELVCAAGLAHPRSRGAAGLASAALLAAVLPANVQMAADICRHRSTAAMVAAVARLPLQLPLMRIGWKAWKSSRA